MEAYHKERNDMNLDILGITREDVLDAIVRNHSPKNFLKPLLRFLMT